MDSQVTYRSGDFAYRLHPVWGEFPDDMKSRSICGIAQCKDGNFYIGTRSDKYPIIVLDGEGKYLKTLGQELGFRRTHGMFSDADGTLWCCDDASNVVYHMTAEGKLLETMGERDGFCDNGYDPTVTWPHDLYTITRAGEPFNRPTKMIRAANGDLYASDGYGNVSVHRFDSRGKLLKTWGGPGRGPGQFRLPHALWADPQNRIWVADRENDRVEVFDADGGFITLFDRLAMPSEVWGDDKYIYINENRAGIAIFDMGLQMVARLGYPGCPLGAHSLGGDSKGNLYLGKLHGEQTLLKLERF